MINIEEQKQNAIYYVCDCGARGVCSFKPLNKDSAIVIDLKCPACQETERMTLLQYESEAAKKNMIRNLNNIDFSWVPFINEEIL